MKRALVIASIVGLSVLSCLDLQAYHRRHGSHWPRRHGTSISLRLNIPVFSRHYGYSGYRFSDTRQLVREIHLNEERIWKLEKKIHKLERRGGSLHKIRQLEREIAWLQGRNDYLRNRLY